MVNNNDQLSIIILYQYIIKPLLLPSCIVTNCSESVTCNEL